MAGTNRYKLAREFIKKLAPKYKKISLTTLTKFISIHLGSGCVVPYMQIMTESELIKEVSEETYTLHPNTKFNL